MTIQPPPPEAIRQATDEVFRRPEFRPPTSGQAWVLRQFASLAQWLTELKATNPVLFWALVAGCAAVLVALVAYAIRKLRAAVTDPPDRVGWKSRGEERERSSAAYRTQAGERAAAGEYTEAVRCLFLSLVHRLDERGRVGFDKAYTNREYLELLGDRASAHAGLELLVNTLDDHWYGQVACGPRQYEECRRVFDRLSA